MKFEKSFVAKLAMAFLAFGFFMAFMPHVIYANPLIENQLTQGILEFTTDVGPWLAGVSLAVGAAFCGWCLFRRSTADEADAKKWTDRAKTAVVCGGAAGVVTGVLPPLLNNYFGI